MSLYRGINMDLTGSERLFGGIKQIIKSIVQTLNKQGLYCRIAAAPALGAAWALSRFGGQTTTIIEAHNLENALAPLPVAALRLPPPLAESLIELNITQIGHLLRIPRSAILSRFDGLLLQQLDLALGRRQEIIVPRKFPPPLKAKITFDGAAIEFTSLICAAQALLKKVLDQLAAHEELSRLVLEIKTLNAAPVFKSIELSVPGKDEKHLWRLLRCKLENIQIGFGIEYMTLSITHRQTRFAAQLHDPSIPVQQGKQSSSAAPANREFGTLLDVLSGQLAAEEICSLACFPSHLPEKSFAYLPLKHPRAPTSRMT
ncbi:MAG TPA: hypothetical protein PLP17_16790, partial [Oligoflexia bacterium]|nr:hypothetical protein [Oligoflexia bacterium]